MGNVKMKINDITETSFGTCLYLPEEIICIFLFNFRTLFTMFHLMNVLSTIQGQQHISINMFFKELGHFGFSLAANSNWITAFQFNPICFIDMTIVTMYCQSSV